MQLLRIRPRLAAALRLGKPQALSRSALSLRVCRLLSKGERDNANSTATQRTSPYLHSRSPSTGTSGHHHSESLHPPHCNAAPSLQKNYFENTKQHAARLCIRYRRRAERLNLSTCQGIAFAIALRLDLVLRLVSQKSSRTCRQGAFSRTQAFSDNLKEDGKKPIRPCVL
jgi:hypothetical protein